MASWMPAGSPARLRSQALRQAALARPMPPDPLPKHSPRQRVPATRPSAAAVGHRPPPRAAGRGHPSLFAAVEAAGATVLFEDGRLGRNSGCSSGQHHCSSHDLTDSKPGHENCISGGQRCVCSLIVGDLAIWPNGRPSRTDFHQSPSSRARRDKTSGCNKGFKPIASKNLNL